MTTDKIFYFTESNSYEEKHKAKLKNIEKYNNIKFAKGLVFDTARKRNRVGNSGISTQKHGDKWYMLPKGRAIFKTFDDSDSGDFFHSVRNMRLVNELICYEISKQIGVICAEYELATKDGETGVVTYDVRKSGEQIIDASTLFFEADIEPVFGFRSYSDALDKMIAKGYKLNKQKILMGIYKLAIFDALTLQSDRHDSNVFFLIDEKKRTLRFSPAIDNEFAFNIKYFDEVASIKKITEADFNVNLENISDLLYLLGADGEETDYPFNENIKQIVRIAKSNEKYAQVFMDMVKSFNLQQVLDKVVNMGIKINRHYEDYLYMGEKIIKTKIKKEITRQLKKSQSKLKKETTNYYDFIQ